MEYKRRVVFKVDDWTDYLEDSINILKLLPHILNDTTIDYYLKFFGFKCDIDKLSEFPHPLGPVHNNVYIQKFQLLIDEMVEKGYIVKKKVKSLRSLVKNFIDAFFTYGAKDSTYGEKLCSLAGVKEIGELPEILTNRYTKFLSDLLKVPQGLIVVEEVEPFTYFNYQKHRSPENSIFGDGKSCFLNIKEKGISWHILDSNNGSVLTVKVFKDEKDLEYFENNESQAIEEGRIIGGGRVLLMEAEIEGDKCFLSFNPYSRNIPFTPNFWYIVLKEFFKDKFSGEPYFVSFCSMDGVFALLNKSIHVNLNGGDLHGFTGFAVTYSKDLYDFLINRITPDEMYDVMSRIACPICRKKTRFIHQVNVDYRVVGDYSFGWSVVGCDRCIASNLAHYLSTIYQNRGLKDKDAYRAFVNFTNPKNYYPEIYEIYKDDEEYEEEDVQNVLGTSWLSMLSILFRKTITTMMRFLRLSFFIVKSYLKV